MWRNISNRLLLLLGLWAYRDRKREDVVLALRSERDKQLQEQILLSSVLSHQGQRIVTDMGKVVEEQSEKTFSSLSGVITEQSKKIITDLSSVLDPLVSSPFDEAAARTEY